MRKKRIWYLIFSLIVSIAIFIGTFYTTNDITFYIAISLIILPNFLMSRTSKSILMIMNEFANNCDSNLYLKNITNFYKSCYLTKKQKIDSKIFLSSVYLETGDLDTLYQKLNELVDEEKNFSYFQKYSYYRVWCSYFFEKKESKKMSALLEQMEKIIGLVPDNIKVQMLVNYKPIRIKCNILEGIYLDEAQNFFTELLSDNIAPLFRLSSHYYLGIINYKKGNLKKAVEEFKYVSASERNHALVTKSKNYLEKINKDVKM